MLEAFNCNFAPQARAPVQLLVYRLHLVVGLESVREQTGGLDRVGAQVALNVFVNLDI